MISQKRKSSLILFIGLSLLALDGRAVLADEAAPRHRRPDLARDTVRAQLTSPFAAEPEKKPSFSQSMKDGFGKMTGMFSSKKEEAAQTPEFKDEIALSNRAEPSPKLHTSLAHVFESQGRLEDAEAEYRKAVELDPQSRLALIEYARFLDRQEQFDRAVDLYLHTQKLHPKDPLVQNDLALCYARHNRNEQAIVAFERAIEMAPRSMLYRNNLAMVLVDLGRYDEALKHLRAVNDNAVAEYDMGYLLHKAGRTDLAEAHFRAAARYNPNMKQAQWWVVRMQRQTPGGPGPRQAIAGPVGLQPPRSSGEPRSPEQTAMRPRPTRAHEPMVWAQSEKVSSSRTPGLPPAKVERIPALRQPRGIVPSQGVIPNQPSRAAQRLLSPEPGDGVRIEPLPPIRR